MLNFKLKYNMVANIFLYISLYRSNCFIITFINQKNYFEISFLKKLFLKPSGIRGVFGIDLYRSVLLEWLVK